MSKEERDARGAVLRAATRHADRPSYRSAERVLERHRLHGLTCLDLCAGNAEFSEILRERFAMRVTCADYAPVRLEHQRARGFDVLRVDLDGAVAEVDRAAAARAGAFDLVVSLAAIEHVFDSDNLLRFCHIVLKPGGLLLLNTPNIAFVGYRLHFWLSGGDGPSAKATTSGSTTSASRGRTSSSRREGMNALGFQHLGSGQGSTRCRAARSTMTPWLASDRRGGAADLMLKTLADEVGT